MKLIKFLAVLRLLILVAALSGGLVNSSRAAEKHEGKAAEAVESGESDKNENDADNEEDEHEDEDDDDEEDED